MTVGPPHTQRQGVSSFDLDFVEVTGNGNHIPSSALQVTPRKSKSLGNNFHQLRVSSTDPPFTGYLVIDTGGKYARWRGFFVIEDVDDYIRDYNTTISYQDWVVKDELAATQILDVNLPGRFHLRPGGHGPGLYRYNSTPPPLSSSNGTNSYQEMRHACASNWQLSIRSGRYHWF